MSTTNFNRDTNANPNFSHFYTNTTSLSYTATGSKCTVQRMAHDFKDYYYYYHYYK